MVSQVGSTYFLAEVGVTAAGRAAAMVLSFFNSPGRARHPTSFSG